MAINRIQFERRFQRNLAWLQRVSPKLFQIYQSYQPQQYSLDVTTSGDCYLLQNGNRVTQQSIQYLAEQQYLGYQRSPFSFSYFPHHNTDQQHYQQFLHVRMMNQYSQLWEQLGKDQSNRKNSRLPNTINIMIQFGAGLGLVLQKLIKQHDIRHFFIYEPDLELFYFSLWLVDWHTLVASFQAVNRSFHLRVGTNIVNFSNCFKRQLHRIGIYGLGKAFFLQHYRSDDLNRDIIYFKTVVRQLAFGWGFFDDELMGLQHTMENLQSKVTYLDPQANINSNLASIPVLLVANGPSIDQSIAIIKQYQQSALVVCCSHSTLSTLIRNEITPDVLAIMERQPDVDQWLQPFDEIQVKQNILLLSTNSICPTVLNRFDQALLVLKSLDAGASLVQACFTEQLLDSIPYCENTGVNLALAVLSHLGCQNFFLFGVDLGYRDPSYHHSQQSDYYKQQNSIDHVSQCEVNETLVVQDLGRYKAERYDLVQLFNIKGEKIFSEAMFEKSKCNIELLLQQNTHVNCFNCGDGVAIQGTIPVQWQTLKLSQVIIDKHQLQSEILQTYGAICNIETNNILEEISARIYAEYPKFVSQLCCQLPQEVVSLSHVIDVLNEQFTLLEQWQLNSKQQIYYRLLRGTVRQNLAAILKLMSEVATPEGTFDKLGQEMWTQCQNIYQTYLKQSIAKLQQDISNVFIHRKLMLGAAH